MSRLGIRLNPASASELSAPLSRGLWRELHEGPRGLLLSMSCFMGVVSSSVHNSVGFAV